ncbi:hypothetical protein GCM10011318_01450 [Phaeocystidibacter marisrubri]|uniref:Bacteriocin-protection protein n=1 Tax=Phaeocystidibacter marisrubri TaxID=1577780 RepID=A0A6L3ZD90_9FLAO|nr:hypothetical protein F8C82_08015 [Phaeocystidibacter marisrubri]GGH64940.1 hypothetical protein GCM10011318_01450 [Phaeocystidibacter marisrubri]
MPRTLLKFSGLLSIEILRTSPHIEEFCPTNQAEWRNWLETNHIETDAVWVIFYKKSSPRFNLSWSDAVDEALCFGWIDSTKKSLDAESYIQYFCKRKAKSNWSKVNKDKAKLLIERGHMTEAGHRSIEVAKENGSWTILDKIENLVVPDDFNLALSQNPKALEFYESLSNSIKKGLLYWVSSAKREETRNKRISEIIENANNGQTPKQFRR